MPDITETIGQIASGGVQTHTGDGQTTIAIPIPDLIAAEKHLAAKAAQAETNAAGGPRSGWAGLRAARPILPGGA